jgi:hypothetical protein
MPHDRTASAASVELTTHHQPSTASSSTSSSPSHDSNHSNHSFSSTSSSPSSSSAAAAAAFAANHRHDDPGGRGTLQKLTGRNVQVVLFTAAWYVCSGVTLFSNKHMLSTLHAHQDLLAASQMTITAVMGGVNLYADFVASGCDRTRLPHTPMSTLPSREFAADMLMVGVMRVVAVLLGLVSLKSVAVSFTETVKSSAPFFTVVFARVMLGERTSMMVSE